MTMGNLGVLGQGSDFGLSLTTQGRAFVLEFWEFAASSPIRWCFS